MSTQVVPDEIVSPYSGELIPTTNVDELWELYEFAKAEAETAHRLMDEIRLAFEKLSPRPEDSQTARATGERCRVKVLYPSDSWNWKRLYDVMLRWPLWGRQYLKVSKVSPVMVEVKKLKNETRPDDAEAFEQCKSMVLGANTGPSGLARLEIEK